MQDDFDRKAAAFQTDAGLVSSNYSCMIVFYWFSSFDFWNLAGRGRAKGLGVVANGEFLYVRIAVPMDSGSSHRLRVRP